MQAPDVGLLYCVGDEPLRGEKGVCSIEELRRRPSQEVEHTAIRASHLVAFSAVGRSGNPSRRMVSVMLQQMVATPPQ
jgi:hypothetical protein